MAKGQQSKDIVSKIIVDALGKHFLGIYDKKIYAQFEEGGEQVQVAIALTCPKTPVAVIGGAATNDWTTPASEAEVAPTTFVPAEITEEEKDNLAQMLERLGL